MGDVVLVVEKDDRVRAGIRNALQACRVPVFEVPDAFDAMSALGRAEFGALVVSAGKRHLSLRGLCQLARKRHPSVDLFIIVSPGITAQQVEAAIGVRGVHLVVAGTTTVDLAQRVADRLRAREPGFEVSIVTDALGPSSDGDSDEATRPFARHPGSGAAGPGPAPVVPAAQVPRGPPSGVFATPVEPPPPALAHAPSGAPRAASGSPARPAPPPAAPRPVVEEATFERTEIRALAPDEPTASNFSNPFIAMPITGVPMGSSPPLADQPEATAAPAPAPADEATEQHVGLYEETERMQVPAALRSAPGTPGAAGAPRASGTASSARPLPGPAPAAPGVATASPTPSLSDVDDDSATIRMPAAPGARAAGLSGAAGFAADDPTVKMPVSVPNAAYRSSQDRPSVKTSAGESLPAPIELPPVPVSGITHASTYGVPDATVPETKLRGAYLDDTASRSHESALFEGILEGRAGGSLLMSLLAQEITGRLFIEDSNAEAQIYLLHGEPVYAEPVNGDAGFLERLRKMGAIPATFRAVLDDGRPIPEGQLLGVLTNRGLLSGQEVHDFLRNFIRERLLELVATEQGSYHFTEEREFLDTKPLLKVNSFGLVLEARRRSTPPDELVRSSAELEWLYPIPGPALAPAAEKLRPFARGANLAEIVNGQKRTREVLKLLGLDALMGALMMETLQAVRLITMSDQPMEELATVKLADTTNVEDRIHLPDSDVADSSSHDESEAREEIFSLYMRLKPLNLPREVLGVPLDADLGAIQAAYQSRMSELDPRRVPEGSARQLMVSRVEELRNKVQQAFEILSSVPTRDPGDKSGPW